MSDRTADQTLALLAGALFLLVGVLGFVPGITTHYGDLAFAGHDSGAQLLGVFQVSVLHNLLHLAFGVVGIALARAAGTAHTYLAGGGVVYLAIWVLGVVRGGTWIPVDTADNWLHFLLGLGMIGLGYVASRGTARAATA
jgi:uncharacterized protein DUF4383